MKKILAGLVAVTLVAPTLSFAATFFTDDFSHGSTLNGPSVPGGTPTASSTSYDIASTKNATSSALAANDLTLRLGANTTSGFWEAQALFTASPVALSVVGDYIDLTIIFTNTTGTLLAGGTSSFLWVGLFNSAGKPPLPGSLVNAGLTATAGSVYATGNCADWQGFAAQISSNGTSRIYTRPQQNGAGTTSANQDLLGNNVGSGAFNNPGATVLDNAPKAPLTLDSAGVYTLYFNIALSDIGTLTISNALFPGVGTGGTALFSEQAITTNLLALSFDGLAIGARNSGTSLNPVMDIHSIVIAGQSTPITTPPSIDVQPAAVSVPAGASCAFSVTATGFGLQYQWHRYGTNLVNGGNISGATSDMLILSPAGNEDVASGANGYYVTVTGTGGYSTNSTTNSLSMKAAANLVWAGVLDVWDLNTTADWLNGITPASFNFGDKVTFDDTGSGNLTVNLKGSYLSASSVTVNSGSDYVFSGSGSFAGPGSLSYIGNGHLTMNNANPYSGGTLISNATAFLVLNNYNALGTGPLTLAKAGGQMEIVPAGNAGLGISGNVIVADDFTINYDASSSFGAVLLGDLSGTAGKTLTINYNNSGGAVSRVRLYGRNTIYDASLNLVDQRTLLAPYQSGGSQTYNGIISGSGGLIQRGSGTTYLNGANTYTGGTTPTTGAIGLGIDSVGNVDSGPIGTGPLFLAPEAPNLTANAAVFASGGARTLANPIQYPSATNNLTLIIGGTNALTFSGPVTLNGNDGTGSVNRTLQVTNTALTTLSGVVGDGSLGCGLTKTGNGILALNNTETYTGPTAVNAGTLQVNGQLGSGAVTAATNATLSGNGTIQGPVSVAAGGALAPGNSIGTLTINNDLTLSGNLAIEINRAGSPNSDKIVVSGALTNAGTGTLTVSNLGGNLAVNDSFAVFSKPLLHGDAMTVTGAGVVWNNKLAVDGTISVQSLVPTTPTNLTFAVSGGIVTLSWPANYTGWTLQAQTNAPGTGLTGNWTRIPNSDAVNQMTFPVNQANGSVFFRLVYP